MLGVARGRTFTDPRQTLEEFFHTPWQFYFEGEISRLREILIHSRLQSWSDAPRLYFVLRGINHQSLISSFLSNGFTDSSLPFDEAALERTPLAPHLDLFHDFLRCQQQILPQPTGVYQACLDQYFPPHRDPKRHPLDDIDFQQISRLLRLCEQDQDSRIPKIYYVLRVINELEALPRFHRQRFDDVWLPVPRSSLGPSLFKNPTSRKTFIQTQKHVCSTRWSDAIHLNFMTDGDEFLDKRKNLGSGGTGYVDHVWCPTLRKNYARKVMPRTEDGLRLFANEINLLKAVSHRHCAAYACSYTDPRTIAILSEPVADMNLATFLDITPLPADRRELLRTSFGCLGVALAYLHTNGIVHKDIKPQNILIHVNTILLTDFGLSTDSTGDGTTVTINTPRYCPPEVDEGERRTESSDMWSMGCVFFEIIAALLGHTIMDLKQYFKRNGSKRLHYKDNSYCVGEWLSEYACSEPDDVRTNKLDGLALAAKDVIHQMLCIEPSERPSIFQVNRDLTHSHLDDDAVNDCCRADILYTQENKIVPATSQLAISKPLSHLLNSNEKPQIARRSSEIKLLPQIETSDPMNGTTAVCQPDPSSPHNSSTLDARIPEQQVTSMENPNPIFVELSSAQRPVGHARADRRDDSPTKEHPARTRPYERHQLGGNTELVINHDGLRSILIRIIGTNYPGLNVKASPIRIVEPFAPIVHSWEKFWKLPQRQQSEMDEQTSQALQSLLSTVRSELPNYFATRQSNRSASLITYESLWTIFPPRTTFVAAPFLGEEQCFELCTFDVAESGSKTSYQTVCGWCWEWNGTNFVQVHYYFRIDFFKGTKPISELNCYPIESHRQFQDFRQTLKLRGRNYDSIAMSRHVSAQHKSYRGPAILNAAGSDNNHEDIQSSSDISHKSNRTPRRQLRTIQGDIIIDPEAFLQLGHHEFSLGNKDANETVILESSLFSDGSNKVDESKYNIFLRPPRVLGYSLSEKRWGQFAVGSINNLQERNPKIFDEQLQLGYRDKNMIKALIEREQEYDQARIFDVVANKGRGAMLLFHGPPGVGKTLTAETMALATARPLIVTSVAEVGLEASKAEIKLREIFYLAERWEAILLFDEADVFVEARSQSVDPNRNALVSVLMRNMEYYGGVLILTTNRVASFDVAILSRIHLAIRYEDLTIVQRQAIFSAFISRIEPEQVKDFDAIMKYIKETGGREKLNGREIRNVVTSALSLAKSEGRNGKGDARLTTCHLKEVMSSMADFHEQLRLFGMVQRGKDADLAMRSRSNS